MLKGLPNIIIPVLSARSLIFSAFSAFVIKIQFAAVFSMMYSANSVPDESERGAYISASSQGAFESKMFFACFAVSADLVLHLNDSRMNPESTSPAFLLLEIIRTFSNANLR